MKFDHIGIAVEDIQYYYKNYLKNLFNCSNLSEVFVDYNQKSKIAFATTENGFKIELIEPLNEESPVTSILQKKRGGLYHICFVANDFEKDINKCLSQKFLVLAPALPAIAFNNRKVIFLLSPFNEVIELIEEEK